MAQASLESLITRLEGVATRLETAEVRLTSGSGSFQAQVSEAGSVSQGVNFVSEYDSSVVPALSSFMVTSEAIGGDVLKPSQTINAAFIAQRGVIDFFAQCKKPDAAGLQKVIQPIAEQLGAATSLTEGRRNSAFNHNKTVADALQALTWILYSGPNCGLNLPAQHIMESWQSAEFFANKIMMEFRNSDPKHVTWVKDLKALFEALRDYVKAYHLTGPSWNPRGVPVSEYKAGGSAPASAPAAAPKQAASVPAAAPPPVARAAPAAPPKPKAAGPPPPPPLPAGGPGSLIKDDAGPKKAAPEANLTAMFAALNKGEAVTSGLKKVTDDMKTKNRADRTGAVPAAAAAAEPSAPVTGPKAIGAAKKAVAPPRFELEQGRKWCIENQVDNREIVVDGTTAKQTVYIFGCRGSTIVVKGKINAITMDGCSRTGVLFDDVVASCELVNSSNVQMQVTGVVPIVAVDKCDGVQLFLSKASLGASITTAKSSEINVTIPGAAEDEFIESAIPEQFQSMFINNKWVTEPVSHGGG